MRRHVIVGLTCGVCCGITLVTGGMDVLYFAVAIFVGTILGNFLHDWTKP